MHPTLIFRRLRSAGVDLVLEGNFNGRRTESVVRRSDVMRVFGTADDPSALDDEEFVVFWNAFIKRCRAPL